MLTPVRSAPRWSLIRTDDPSSLFNALRDASKKQLIHQKATAAELTHFETRVHRLASDKSVIPQLIIQLTDNGTKTRFLPIGLRQAMRYIDERTRGQ